MSSKRGKNESFEDYRARLKVEKAALIAYLKGKMVHTSVIVVPHPKDPNKLVKVRAQGTYRKGDK